MATQYIVRRSSSTHIPGKVNAATIWVDSDDNKLKVNVFGSGTADAVIGDESVNTYAVDGAISLSSQTALLTKGSAGAYSVAAPGVAGLRLTITTGSDFAHIVTFTGGTLWDGTAGANTTWTAAAVQGSSLTVVSISATKWNVVSFNLGLIAP